MKFLDTCILALLLITQQILADGAGAADTDATDSLEQYDGSSGTDLLAQEIKRARIPQFVGKRDYFANDDIDMSADSQDIPIEVAQAFERNLLSSLLAGSNEGLPEEGATQSDYFGRQTRYIPMMVGRRGKWAPKFVGKRRGPLFVGRRRSPYFVGKRTSQTDNMAAEKRRNPMFVGKRADPVLVARGLSKPMFVGRRGHPMFVGRRTASGDLDSSIFMGKR
ncbi:MIP-related peptides-like [Pecten maximus]|uniref:MIP-related peptides-like n=1 Tax=Pecten maximus TaxID=6579 RepID=UPI001458A1EC|nr:MIP-related peptides-like [Pecten maximus]